MLKKSPLRELACYHCLHCFDLTWEAFWGVMDSRPKRKLSNETHRSRTDPDTTLAEKKGSPRQLKYKVHQSIDAYSRVILDTHVTTGARHDNQPYLDQLQRIRDRYKLTIRTHWKSPTYHGILDFQDVLETSTG